MGRGPDTKPRKLQWTPPMFVTEAEATSMGLPVVDVRALETVGTIAPPKGKPEYIYRYDDVVRAINDNGDAVDLDMLKEGA